MNPFEQEKPLNPFEEERSVAVIMKILRRFDLGVFTSQVASVQQFFARTQEQGVQVTLGEIKKLAQHLDDARDGDEAFLEHGSDEIDLDQLRTLLHKPSTPDP